MNPSKYATKKANERLTKLRAICNKLGWVIMQHQSFLNSCLTGEDGQVVILNPKGFKKIVIRLNDFMKDLWTVEYPDRKFVVQFDRIQNYLS